MTGSEPRAPWAGAARWMAAAVQAGWATPWAGRWTAAARAADAQRQREAAYRSLVRRRARDLRRARSAVVLRASGLTVAAGATVGALTAQSTAGGAVGTAAVAGLGTATFLAAARLRRVQAASARPLPPPPPPLPGPRSTALPAVLRLDDARSCLQQLLNTIVASAPGLQERCDEAWSAAAQAEHVVRVEAVVVASLEETRATLPPEHAGSLDEAVAARLRGVDRGVAAYETLVGAAASLMASAAGGPGELAAPGLLPGLRLQEATASLNAVAAGLSELGHPAPMHPTGSVPPG